MTSLLHGIPAPLPGERVLHVEPAIAPQIRPDETWRRRTNLFPGRALGQSALQTDQRARASRLALAGQALSPGVIAGLEVSLEGVATLRVAPGFGIAVTGEDVRLTQPLSVQLDTLPLELTRGSTAELPLSEWLGDDPPFDPFPLVAIVLLVPSQVRRIAEQDPEDPCERSAEELAFEDQQLVDAARLVLVAYPYALPLTVQPTWRNELAYKIFREEAKLGAFDVLPWDASGLGLAMIGWSSRTAAPFVDIHAVARDGGELNRRRALSAGAGTRQLWQARVRQFIDHLGAAESGALPAGTRLADQFKFLPPVGALPPGAIDVRGDRGEPHIPLPPSPLFPETFVLEAAPVELESLDDYLHASGGLSPLALDAAEQIQVLVPVPQQFFSPDLLRVEDETPDEFREAIRLFLLRLNHRLGRRSEVRIAEDRLSLRLFGRKPERVVPDPEAVPGEVLTGFPDDDELPEAERPIEEVEYAKNIDRILQDLGKRMAEVAGPSAFVRVLAKLVSENGGALSDFANDITADQAARVFLSSSAGGAGLVSFVEQLSRRLIIASEALDVAFSRMTSNLFELRQLSSGDALATQLAITPVLPFIVRNRTELVASGQVTQFKAFLDSTRIVSDVAAPTRFRGAPRTVQVLSRQLPGAEGIPAAVAFNEDIKKRLESPPALDVAENATRAKRSAFRALRSVHNSGLSLAGGQLRFPGFLVEIKTAATPPERTVPDPTKEPPDPAPLEPSLEATLDNGRLRALDVPISWVIAYLEFFEKTGYWPHDPITGLNEGAVLATSFESIEHTIAALRLAEARLAGLERALSLARVELLALSSTWNQLQRRLRELGDEIGEFRRDVRVARALELEEIARAQRVNNERRQVLAEHVPFLVFRRPRTQDALSASPTQIVAPALAPDPVPAALRGNFETPDQLRAMVDLFREAPLAWSPLGAALLPNVNRQFALHQIARVALFRAANPEPLVYNPFANAAFDDDSGRAIRTIYESQRRAISDLRALRLRLEFASFLRFSWGGLITELQPVATVNDLILSAHGRQEVSNALSRHLDDVNRVVASLFEHMRQVQPILRFVWAELLEEAHTPVDLRKLSVLPDWELVDPSDQRNMQRFVDWLYQQVSRQRQDALGFMHDLVRMTILLSSHAPVNQTLPAQPVNVRPVIAGAVVDLALDAERVRVGMHVQLFESAGPVPAAAEGVIEDLSQGIATVRIAHTESDRSVLPVRAELIEPDRNPQLSLANGKQASFGFVGGEG